MTKRPDGTRLSRWVTGFLALVAVAATVLIVVELVVLRPAYDDVQDEQQARADVVRVAQRFTAQINNYDPESIEAYEETITPLLTTKFADEFSTAMEDLVTQVKEAEMTSSGEVLTSAVASVDPDSAQVLVVADATVKTVFDDRARHFRWEVSLVKVDGDWLVDDFEPVA